MIDRFIDKYAFLSNFYLSTFRWKGKLWKTVEHAYQASKTLDEKQQEMIRNSPTPGHAKRMGQAVLLRPDWDMVKVDIMRELVRLKFENPLIRPSLLATGDEELIEGNKWNDKFWGVCRGEGLNMLGQLLMEERKRISEELTQEDE